MGATSLLEFYHHHLGELAAVLMAFFSTLSVVAWTSTSRRVGVLAVCCLRLTAASILLLVWGGLVRGRWLPTDIDGPTWIILIKSGILGYFLGDLLAIKSFMVIGPRLTLLLQSLSPPLVTIYGYYGLGESLGAASLLGMCVTLTGVGWVVLERPESPKEKHHRKDFAIGIAIGVASAIFGAWGTIYARIGVARVDPMAATQIRILAALLCYPPLVTIMGRWWQIGKALQHAQAMQILAWGTLVGPFLAMGLYMYALKVCNSTGVVNTIACITPVLILPFSILIYKDKVSLRAALGAAVSVIGIMIMLSFNR